ncbi:MAG: hypothetical protein HY321_05975 [Armatimonadetes bacterium]|nr:hypothetical protein [Armatimonadota bacterium]
MRDAAIPPAGRARRQAPILCWLLTGLLTGAALSPALAAPPKRAAQRSTKVAIKKVTAETSPVMTNLAPTIHDQIAILERSAAFWRSAGTSVGGVDQRTAWLLSLACQERALRLRARRARQEGDHGQASLMVSRAESVRRQWRRPAPSRQMQPGMMQPGMMVPGMDPGMMMDPGGAAMPYGGMAIDPGGAAMPMGGMMDPGGAAMPYGGMPIDPGGASMPMGGMMIDPGGAAMPMPMR